MALNSVNCADVPLSNYLLTVRFFHLLFARFWNWCWPSHSITLSSDSSIKPLFYIAPHSPHMQRGPAYSLGCSSGWHSWTLACSHTATCSPSLPFNGLHLRNSCKCTNYYSFTDPRGMWGWVGLAFYSSYVIICI